MLPSAAVKDSVKALTVGGVAPTEATVKDGSYVVQRPFVLVTKDGTKLSDAAQKFFDFATSADAVSDHQPGRCRGGKVTGNQNRRTVRGQPGRFRRFRGE